MDTKFRIGKTFTLKDFEEQINNNFDNTHNNLAQLSDMDGFINIVDVGTVYLSWDKNLSTVCKLNEIDYTILEFFEKIKEEANMTNVENRVENKKIDKATELFNSMPKELISNLGGSYLKDEPLSLKEEILKELENIDDLFCGDVWFTIKNEQFKHGLFCQVEVNEDDESNYDFYAYENIAIDKNGYLITNFDITIAHFQISKEAFNSSEKNIKKVHDELFKEHDAKDTVSVMKELSKSQNLDYK